MTRRALLVLALAGCGGGGGSAVSVRAQGNDIVLDGDVALRALRVELAWEAGVTVNGIGAGRDAARSNLLRSALRDGGATVVLSDTRRIKLPQRGIVLQVQAGGAAVRVVSAEGVDEDPGGAPRRVVVGVGQ